MSNGKVTRMTSMQNMMNTELCMQGWRALLGGLFS